MKFEISLYRHLWLTTLVFALGLAGCSEKAALPQPVASNPNADATGNDDDEDDDGDDDTDGNGDDDGSGGGGSTSFDLCEAMESEGDLDDWQQYVEELCDGGKLIALRKSEMVYKGGSKAKVNIGSEKSEGNIASFRLFTSSVVPTSVDKYWRMMKMQFFKPDDFEENFELDKNLDRYKILDENGESSVEYHYINTKQEASPVDYEAKSDFITLKNGQAYIVATVLTKSNETMKDLDAVIIINAKTSSSTEVIVVSDQRYDKGGQTTEVARDNARESLGDEQIRSFENAEKAEKFFD